MPELPEIETIINDLRPAVVGKRISQAAFINPSLWRNSPPDVNTLLGARITDLARKGKNILISLSNGNTIVIHLKMTGQLTCERCSAPRLKHTHFSLRLGNCELRYRDTRRFGYLDLVPSPELGEVDYLRSLGPDPLELSAQEFLALLKSRSRMIKALLLDQRVISGLGNIYTDEALFAAGIHPRAISSRIGAVRAKRLYGAIRRVLRAAIGNRGSSVADYVDGTGRPGRFQQRHRVYGRQGQACRRCGKPIRRIKIGGRSSHYCPRCQT